MWILDRDIPDMVPFDPSLPTMDIGGGPLAVWGAPTGELITTIIVGGICYWYHLEGGAWVNKGAVLGNSQIISIHGTSYSDVWAVSDSGSRVFHFDGSTWTQDVVLTGTDPQDVFALDENNVFVAAGLNPSTAGLWFRRSGAYGAGVWDNEWSQMGTDTGYGSASGAQNVVAFAADDVYFTIWISTIVQRLVHWNGATWTASDAADKAPTSHTLSEAGGKLWWRGYSGGYGYSKVLHLVAMPAIVDQGTLTGTYGGGDLIMVDEQLGYSVGEGPGDNFRIWETTDGGSSWVLIVDHDPSLLVTPGMGLALWNTAPQLQNETPAQGATDQSRHSTIGGDVFDVDGNLDASTVRFWVNNTLAWFIGIPTTGWSGSRTAITNGYSYSFTPDASMPLPAGINTARVYAEDTDGNVLDETWTFEVTVVEEAVDSADVAGEENTGIDLKLNDHDVVVENYDLVLVAGVDEVAQHIEVGLKLFLGEWYLDENAGMPYYRDVFIANPKTRIVESVFRQEILSDNDIERIDAFELSINRATRKLDVEFECTSSVGVVNVESVFP
jgi:hypothetical protein